VVKDCGPCNSWFEVLRFSGEIRILNDCEIKELIDKRQIPVRLLPKSYRSRYIHEDYVFDKSELYRFRNAHKTSPEMLEGTAGVHATREIAHDFYQWPKTSGSERRKIANLSEVQETLSASFGIRSIDFFKVTPREAIKLVSAAPIFIAQKGAALMNMAFLREGGLVVEILPLRYLVSGNRNLYRKFAAALGLKYERVWQTFQKGNVDVKSLIRRVNRFR
jgi:hypothetical protein